MKLNLSQLGTVKLAVHTLQGILLFVTICITIAKAAQKGSAGGAGIWYNVLCFATIPCLIYLSVVPLWQRSQKFANVYAFLAIDVLLAIFWLSAWAALVAWVRNGISSGADLKKIDVGQANCTVFDPAFGTEKKCDLGNVCVGFGVVIFVLFIVTAVISYLYFRKVFKNPDGSKPWLGKSSAYGAPGGIEGGKDTVWSTDTHDIDQAAHHHRTGSSGTERGGNQEEDEYQLLHGTETEGGYHPGRRFDEDQHNRYDAPPHSDIADTSYKGAAHDGYHGPPSTLSPDGYERSSADYPSTEYPSNTSYGPNGAAYPPAPPYSGGYSGRRSPL